MISVLVVDDQSLVRAGFRMIIESEPDLVVVGEAADGVEAVAVAERSHPDVVLMDIRMPRMDGVEATRILAGRAKILMLTTFDLDEYVVEALRAGASGFLLKDVTPEDLVAAIRVVARGDALLAPSITKRLLDRFVERAAPDVRAKKALETLTERERQVLELVATGSSNAEVAKALFVSETTVKSHVSHLLMKLGVRDRVQLVVFAYEAGVTAPGSRG